MKSEFPKEEERIIIKNVKRSKEDEQKMQGAEKETQLGWGTLCSHMAVSAQKAATLVCCLGGMEGLSTALGEQAGGTLGKIRLIF